jgi:transposase
VIRPHKIALDPTPDQAVYFSRACGVARFAWNYALAEWQRQYNEWREYLCGPRPSEVALRRQLNEIKGEQFPWMLDVTKNAPQQAIKNVGTAFKNFFEGRPKYPKFKKKGKSHDSFRADNGPTKDKPNAVDVDGKRVKLPVIGWIKMRENCVSMARSSPLWCRARFCCKDLGLVAGHHREDEMTSQAATWNSPAMNSAWALMSLPLMLRTCPFLIIAIAS